MNSTEAMMLREDAAEDYLRRLDQHLSERFPDEVEIAMMIKMGYENSRDGECTINEALVVVLDTLDDLDEEDAFGTWGWRHSVMGEV